MIDSEQYRSGLLSPIIIIPEYLNSISIHLFNWRIYYSRYVTTGPLRTQINLKLLLQTPFIKCYKWHMFAIWNTCLRKTNISLGMTNYMCLFQNCCFCWCISKGKKLFCSWKLKEERLAVRRVKSSIISLLGKWGKLHLKWVLYNMNLLHYWL